jgi:hypothetical protein
LTFAKFYEAWFKVIIASTEKEGNGSRIKREGDATKRVMATNF